jgi:hypothetical protein
MVKLAVKLKKINKNIATKINKEKLPIYVKKT